jgi:hypothetical protein
MTGSRSAAVGLALLSVVAMCALVAQGADAAFTQSTKLTAYTCALNGGAKDFSDAHCDRAVPPPTGSFGHVLITGKTPIVATNAKTASSTTASTPAILSATVAGIPTKITATTVTGTGFVENSGTEANMKVSGEVTTEFSGITVNEPANCTVKPIKFSSTFVGVEEGTKMGLEFKPASGTVFAELTYEGASCGLKGVTAKVSGSAIGTGGAGSEAAGSGGTKVLESGNGMESLKIGTATVSVTSVETIRMAPVEGVEQNPISLTTK